MSKRPELPGLWARLHQGDETAILGEGPETVAEVIVEPVMSGVGIAVPADEYLPKVESLCRKYGILLHVDGSSTASAEPARCSLTSITACRPTSSRGSGKIGSNGTFPDG